MKQHEITIFDKKNALIYDSNNCLKECNLNHQFTIVYIRKIRIKNISNDF